MLPDWQRGIVKQIEPVNALTRRFFIELPEVESFDFKPGQFVTLDLPVHEQRNRRWRSYSIASAPDGGKVIELIIVLLEGGTGTTYLFNEVQVGQEILLRGPLGIFVLPESLDKELFLICTGTGIAPFRSMLQHLRVNPRHHKPIHLIFGTRTQSDLLYRDEMQELEKQIPDFHYHPILSREEWKGRQGYLHVIYEELCSSLQPAEFFICGWKDMVEEAKKRILDLGYEKKSIHLELYG